METFAWLNKEIKATILMVTHDAFSACYCKRILFMRDGKVVHELLRDNMDNDEMLASIVSLFTQISRGGRDVS